MDVYKYTQNSLENFNFYANMNIKSTENLKTYVYIYDKNGIGTSKTSLFCFICIQLYIYHSLKPLQTLIVIKTYTFSFRVHLGNWMVVYRWQEQT